MALGDGVPSRTRFVLGSQGKSTVKVFGGFEWHRGGVAERGRQQRETVEECRGVLRRGDDWKGFHCGQ